MQARVTARKLHWNPFRYRQSWADHLQCPTQYARVMPSGGLATKVGPERAARWRRSSTRISPTPRMTKRSMATAVAEQPRSYDDDPSPLAGPPPSSQHPWLDSGLGSDFVPSTSSPIILNPPTPLSSASTRFPKGLTMYSDGHAELADLLDACVRVNRFERAATLVRQYRRTVPEDAPELLRAHNRYLRGLTDYVMKTRSEEHLKMAQKWFELEIRSRGSATNGTTFALLLKASMHALQGPKLARTMRRYINQAKDVGQDVELLNSSLLSDAEVVEIIKVHDPTNPAEVLIPPVLTLKQACPTDYYPVDEEEEVESLDQSPVPEMAERWSDLRPVGQKGRGLETLQKSVSLFSDAAVPYPDDLDVSRSEKDQIYRNMRQRRIESDAVKAAIERWREDSRAEKKLGIHRVFQTPSIGRLLWNWHIALRTVIEKELESCDHVDDVTPASQVERDRKIYGPFLRLLSAEKLSAITILEMMAKLGSRNWTAGMAVTSLVKGLGRAVHQEYATEVSQRTSGTAFSSRRVKTGRRHQLVRLMKRRHMPEQNVQATFGASTTRSNLLDDDDDVAEWNPKVEVHVGTFLISGLLRTAELSVPRRNLDTNEEAVFTVPAFHHVMRLYRGHSVGALIAHPSLAQMLAKEPPQHCLAKHLPMVVEPREWRSFSHGGYLDYSVGIMRSKGVVAHRQYIEAATQRGDMDRVFTALNVLAKTPWRINRAIFDVMAEAWNTGDALADMPPENPTLNEPPDPGPDASDEERRRWMFALRQARNLRLGLHSQRCFQNFQLEVARAYLDETFYFPHNMDFRGRAYPTPPYLNHLAADNCRGLLLFAQGRPLGTAGLRWLRIHLANVCGFDKRSFIERENFTREHLADVYDSATRPLTGRRWWLAAENPWQCLATCMELVNAMDSPDPTQFVSHLPVHQDGTCNGLQHYAALGGDLWGAKQVNLVASDRPADVYGAVAKLVDDEITSEAAKGDPLYIYLSGKVTRRIVKQTVMTNVYGVTRFGANKQVERHLKDSISELPESASFRYGQLAAIIGEKIFKALSTMFAGTHEIQHWLTESAGRICRSVTARQLAEMTKEHPVSQSNASPNRKPKMSKNKRRGDARFETSVVWTTPLKMPVVQPYRLPALRYAITSLQRIHLSDGMSRDVIDRRKQMSAFPPNFIHSLDATHMFLSALQCDQAGLTFAAVHDSYWTHACDVDTMSRILREAFISIHSSDLIGRLAEEFVIRNRGSLYMATVRSNSVVGNRVKAWRRDAVANQIYRDVPFCATASDDNKELLYEYRRQQLLNSDNEIDQAAGRQMITPATIFEEEAAKGSSASSSASDKTGARTTVDARQAMHFGPGVMDESDEMDKPFSNMDMNKSDADEDVEANRDPEATIDETDVAEHGALDVETEEDVEMKSYQKQPKTKPKTVRKLQIWLPISFPPVPNKGGFDVNQLRDSPYFFC